MVNSALLISLVGRETIAGNFAIEVTARELGSSAWELIAALQLTSHNCLNTMNELLATGVSNPIASTFFYFYA